MPFAQSVEQLVNKKTDVLAWWLCGFYCCNG